MLWSISYLQVFDGLLGHELLLLVPLHRAHDARPYDADHGLLGDAGLLHLLAHISNHLQSDRRVNTMQQRPYRAFLHGEEQCDQLLTSLSVSPRAICSCSSFCSSLRAPMDCWLRAKSESSFRPASVKYLEKCSQLRLLAGKSSCVKEIPGWGVHTQSTSLLHSKLNISGLGYGSVSGVFAFSILICIRPLTSVRQHS